MPRMYITAALTVVIASAWVGVAQLARMAELSPGCRPPASGSGSGGVEALSGGLGPYSCAHFITWLNGSCWIFLGAPWLALQVVRCSRRRSGAPANHPADPDCGWRHVALFFVLALGTNYAYIAALEYIPASLNTAVFSTSPVLTLALSVQFLSEPVTAPRAKWASVMLSIAGVLLISEPWVAFAEGGGMAARLADRKFLGCGERTHQDLLALARGSPATSV